MAHHPVEDSNPTDNPHIETIGNTQLSRRALLRGGASAVTAGALIGLGLSGCGSDSGGSGNGGGSGKKPTMNPGKLGFASVAKSLEDRVIIPDGYRAEIIYALGDPIFPGVPAYRNDGTDEEFEKRAGDHHDGMEYFGVTAQGEYDEGRSDRGILCINHENLTDPFLHRNGSTAAASNGGKRPKIEVDREMNGHGAACIEVRKQDGQWSLVVDSSFNRRITVFTEMEVTGPAAGDELLKSKTSPDARVRYGMLNNCATGKTPWGTFVTCEENWSGYWRRGDDAALRSAADNALLDRYGMGNNRDGWAYREWNTVSGGSDVYQRFDISVSGVSAEQDYRNEANLFGYVVEIDPLRPGQRPKVRTSLGRYAHETASFAPAVAGQPIVCYSGDDARGEYIYKFVSDALWDPADLGGGLSAGDKYLNEGTLYVARFNDDGSGDWLPLTPSALAFAGGDFPFTSQARILVGARLAADALGATRMDRPEWGMVSPINGEVYFTLTNNRLGRSGMSTVADADPANPRVYEDVVGDKTGSKGNVNGHIIRWKESGNQNATSFTWDIFLFGSDADADDSSINLSGLDASNEFSSPDGIFIDPRGVLWIQTDDSALSDKTNNQMLACLPGAVGDGDARSVVSAVDTDSKSVTTYVGKSAADVSLQRFLVGPVGCEITGIAMTPDARTLFVNVQHPGENGDLGGLVGTWPNPNRDPLALADGNSRPRSATIVIYRADGGEIGL